VHDHLGQDQTSAEVGAIGEGVIPKSISSDGPAIQDTPQLRWYVIP
jgi:hypothetical protein